MKQQATLSRGYGWLWVLLVKSLAVRLTLCSFTVSLWHAIMLWTWCWANKDDEDDDECAVLFCQMCSTVVKMCCIFYQMMCIWPNAVLAINVMSVWSDTPIGQIRLACWCWLDHYITTSCPAQVFFLWDVCLWNSDGWLVQMVTSWKGHYYKSSLVLSNRMCTKFKVLRVKTV